MKLTIAVCTAKRPGMLQKCLDSLLILEKPEGWEVDILVVENDDKPNCKKLVKEKFPTVRYVHEKERGIPFARNRALKEAKGSGWLLCIDDDETASSDLLIAYDKAMRKYKADVYHGTVSYIYPNSPPAWFNAKQPSQKPSGTSLKTAAGGNVLISNSVFDKFIFSDSFRLTGGEDTDYFYRAVEAGYKIVWVQEAIVYEKVVPERLTMSYQLKRAFRVNANNSFMELKRRGTLKALLRYLPKFINHLVLSLVTIVILPILVLFPRKNWQAILFKGFKKLASAGGIIAGLLAIQPNPYKAIQGY